MSHAWLVGKLSLTKECGITFLKEEEHRCAVKQLDGCLHDNNKIWQMTLTKIEEASPEEIKTIKNNSPKLIKLDWDPEPHSLERNKSNGWKKSTLDYCNFIYNPPIHIIYMIPEKKEPINSCISESESNFNPDSNSDNNNNENNSSSSAPNSNKNYDDSNSDSNPKTFITLPNFTKEQKLKWFSDNGKDIMPKCTHDTDTGFDLRYSEKDAIKLEPHSCTCIDLKIALEILATTIIQLASKNSLAKKRINIRRGIIDTEYVGNIIAMLQNDLEKTYIIDPNEKIAQVIFLFLMKIAQLVLVRTREELGITAKGI
ncbi:hypothetical protein G9A89_015696 [Geosiphon pyriformis]|nr:hypothetical protein G9A89_015696 [Geosiphon pyriformis]